MQIWSNFTVINTEVYGCLTGNSVLHLSWLFNVFPNPIISDFVKQETFSEGLVDPLVTWAAVQWDLHRLEERGSTNLKKFAKDKRSLYQGWSNTMHQHRLRTDQPWAV